MITVPIPHSLPKAEAIKRIQSVLDTVKKDYSTKIKNFSENWTGDTGTLSGEVMGFTVSGTISVSDTNVVINAELPLAASFFKDKIIAIIKQKGSEALSK